MDYVDWLQWPAMAVSVCAAWMVASDTQSRREAGFWVFLASNVLWIAWGFYSASWALVLLQLALGVMNIRGVKKNDAARQASARR